MKGQTALEYLITYGWAILVILVVLAVLWYYGVFSPGKWAGESVSEGSAFKVVDKQLTGNTLTLILGDKTGGQTTISLVEAAGDITGSSGAISQVIQAGGQTGQIAVTLTAPVAPGVAVGSFYRFTVTTTYVATGGIPGQKDIAQFNIKAV